MTPPDPLSAGPSGDGPPGGRIFSLEGRTAPGLYLVAWLLSLGGSAALVVTILVAPSPGRTVAAFLALAALGLGLAAAAGYQVLARAERAPAGYRGPSPLVVFGVVLVLSTLVSGLLGSVTDPEQPFGFLLGLVLVALSYAICVWLLVVRSGALTWAEMGWPTGGARRLARSLAAIGTGVLVAGPMTFAALIAGGIVAMLLGVEAPDTVPSPATSGEALAVVLAAALVAPIGEELFFRGFALAAWARDLTPRGALLRSAGFFAVVHIANITATTFAEGAGQALLQLAVIFPLGLVLGWLFLRGGVLASIAGHVTYNTILLALLLLQTGTATG